MATHLFGLGTSEGLSCFVSGQPARVIPWDQIESISAFHRKDAHSEFAVIWFRVPTDTFPVEFTERDPKWPDLLQSFAKHLRGFVPFEKWFPRDIHPVFEKTAYGIYAKNA